MSVFSLKFSTFRCFYNHKQPQSLIEPAINHTRIHRVQKKGATDFFAVTFTNIDGFS